MSFRSTDHFEKQANTEPLLSKGLSQCKSACDEHSFDGSKCIDQNSPERTFNSSVSGDISAAPRFGHDFSLVPTHSDMVRQAMPSLSTGTMVQRFPESTTEEAPPAPEATPTPAAPEPEEESAAPEETAAPALIVEDSATELSSGQMRKSEFLAQLRAAVTSTAEAALAGTGRTTADCPYLMFWFGYYNRKDSVHIERAIHKYAPETKNATSARGYIPIIAARVSLSVKRWAKTGEITGLPEGMPMGLMGMGLLGGLGSLISGIGSISFKAREGGAKRADNPLAIKNELGEGHPLEGGVRSRMESAFGRDFSHVRTHTDTSAAGLSDRLNARAFTVGKHVAFGAGEYQPGTLVGDALIAHEMAHVVQQKDASRTSDDSPKKGSESEGALEADADLSAVHTVASLWTRSKSGMHTWIRQLPSGLRSGLTLQRCTTKSRSERTKAQQEVPPQVPANPTDIYRRKLLEGAEKIKKIGFGRAEGEGKGGRVDPAEKYDKEYWKEVVVKGGEPEFRGGVAVIHVDETVLELKPGKLPSDAIDALFAHPEKWNVECAQFVQVLQWYALRHSMGAEAFNKSVKGQPFRLRVHHATGVKKKLLYSRDKPTEKMKYGPIGEEKEMPNSVDDLLAKAPIGSRVMWTNLKAPGSSDFRHENTIKVGSDMYLAHGFGEKKLFSREQLELKFAQAENSNADAAYIRENVFIADIEMYETP